jgi:hypothetical protein
LNPDPPSRRSALSFLHRRPLVLALALLLSALGRAHAAPEEEPLRDRLERLIATGDYEAALELTDRAVEEMPDSLAVWQARAYALHRLGRKAAAEVAYRSVLRLDPKNGWAWTNLGELLASLYRWPEAVAAAERGARLLPGRTEARVRFTRILRESGDYERAASVSIQALEAGADPAACHAELGYVWWVLEELERSRRHWKLAREAGADEEACDHGERLCDWDRPRGGTSERAEVARRRRGDGPEWEFAVGAVVVRTRVGPALPSEIRCLLADLQSDFGRFLDTGRVSQGSVCLVLSRTLEAHELHRMRRNPAGYSGSAFLTEVRGARRGPPGRRRSDGPGVRLELYVAWPAPGLERRLSHEVAHALLRLRLDMRGFLPVWLDEGVATYLELAPGRRGRPVSRGIRNDLLEELDRASEEGSALRLEELLLAGRPAFLGETARIRYAQAWSLVHFLLHGRGVYSKARRFETYLDRIAGSFRVAPDETFREIYGPDLEKLEASWREHVERLRVD